MTAAQKWIAVFGLAAVALTACFAPYDYTAHSFLQTLSTSTDHTPWTGTVHRPLWSPPYQGVSDPSWLIETAPNALLQLDEVHLNAGKLGLWWGGIAAVTIVAIVLAAPSKWRNVAASP